MSTESSAHDDLNDGPPRRTWRSYARWSFWFLLFLLACYIGWAVLWIRDRTSIIKFDTYLADSVAIVFPQERTNQLPQAAPFPLGLFGDTGEPAVAIWFVTESARATRSELKADEFAVLGKVKSLYPEAQVTFAIVADDYNLAMMRALHVAYEAGFTVSGEELEAAGWKPEDDAETILRKARSIRPAQ